MVGIGRSRTTALLTVLSLVLSLSWSMPVSAAEDFDSLRAAITAANAGGESTITLTEDIRLSGTLPVITGSVTIEGDGRSISGAGMQRIFDVAGARLVIRNLVLTKGSSEDGGALRIRNGADVQILGSTFSDNRAVTGGAITTRGRSNRLTIENSSFSGNRSEESAAAIYSFGSSVAISGSSFTHNYSLDYGGALVTASGELKIANSTFQSNRAASDGATIYVLGGEATLTHLTMTGNIAATGIGNAIARRDGVVRLRNSIVAGGGSGDDCANGLTEVRGNLSRDGTCGILPSEDALLGQLTGTPAWRPLLDGSPAIDAAEPEFCTETDQLGTVRPHGDGCDIGAIESTTALPPTPPIEPPPPCPLALRIVAANTDAPAGGCPAGSGHDIIVLERDIELDAALPAITSDITIEGNGLTISGGRVHRIFKVRRGKLTLNNMTLTKGIEHDANSGGGAVWLEAVGRLEANRVVFSNNRGAIGGAIGVWRGGVSISVNNSHFVDNIATHRGGAIGANGGGNVTVKNSSFVNNSGPSGGAIGSFSGTVSVTNSTFVGNQAGLGGAISVGGGFSDRSLPITLTHVTMLNNFASSGDGIFVEKSDYGDIAVRLRNSIIMGRNDKADDCEARLAQNTSNFIADGSCSPMLSGDPMLAEVEEAAAQVALLPGSPAIDAANANYCLERDQVGTPRPLGYGCDIGAIEMIPEPEALSGCQVTTTHNLNFRDSPKGERIGSAPHGATLKAKARTPGWFNVEQDGGTGWISADYVVTEGECS